MDAADTPTKYLVLVGREKTGPYTEEEVEDLFKAGKITRQTYMWTHGWAAWKQLGELLSEPGIDDAPPVPIEKAEKTQSGVRDNQSNWVGRHSQWVAVLVITGVVVLGAFALLRHHKPKNETSVAGKIEPTKEPLNATIEIRTNSERKAPETLTKEPINIEEQRIVSGTVYIVTAGGNTVRLPMVERVLTAQKSVVLLQETLKLDEEALETKKELLTMLRSSRNPKRAEIDKQAEEVRNALKEIHKTREEWTSRRKDAEGLWEVWKGSVHAAKAIDALADQTETKTVAKSDVDGKFEGEVPKDATMLLARARREIAGGLEAEEYGWLVRIPNETKVRIELNNDNRLEFEPEMRRIIKETTQKGAEVRLQFWRKLPERAL